MVKEKRLHTIKTTEKALDLLQIVTRGEGNLNINDLSQKLKIEREEVLLLLVAMENRGMVAWDSGNKVYNPGGAVMEMVGTLARRFRRLNPVHRTMMPSVS